MNFLGLYLAGGRASAFWDGGHAVVGAVAELVLKADASGRGDLILRKLEEDLVRTAHMIGGEPYSSNLPLAALWSDLIKCKEPNGYLCKNLRNYDHFRRNDGFHWFDLCKPRFSTSELEENYDVRATILYRSNPGSNVLDAVVSAVETLSGVDLHVHQSVDLIAAELREFDKRKLGKGGAGAYENLVRSVVVGTGRREGSAVSEFSHPGPSPFARGSSLRDVLHFVGDLHQPLHVCCAMTDSFPYGDQGATQVDVQYGARKLSLHTFWDSAAGLLRENYDPLKAAEFVLEMRTFAKELVRVNASLVDQIWKEERNIMVDDMLLGATRKTNDLCHKVVYDESVLNYLNKGSDVKDDAQPLTLSRDYVNAAQNAIKEQLVAAGVRLGLVLLSLDNIHSPYSLKRTERKYKPIVIVVVVLIVIGGLVLNRRARLARSRLLNKLSTDTSAASGPFGGLGMLIKNSRNRENGYLVFGGSSPRQNDTRWC